MAADTIAVAAPSAAPADASAEAILQPQELRAAISTTEASAGGQELTASASAIGKISAADLANTKAVRALQQATRQKLEVPGAQSFSYLVSKYLLLKRTLGLPKH